MQGVLAQDPKEGAPVGLTWLHIIPCPPRYYAPVRFGSVRVGTNPASLARQTANVQTVRMADS